MRKNLPVVLIYQGILSLLVLLLTGSPSFAQIQDIPLKERGSLFKIGRSVNLTTDEQAENIITLGGDVNVRGYVRETVISIGGKIIVSGTVKESVIAIGEDVILEAGAAIGGDAVSFGGEVRRDSAATVRGAIKGEKYWNRLTEQTSRGARFGARFLAGKNWYGFIVGLVASLVFGLILTYFLPRPMQNQSDAITRVTLRVIVLGVVAAIIFIPLIVLLGITILGIPLIPFLILAYFYAGFIGLLACSLLLGKNLMEQLRLGVPGMMGSLAIGLVIMALIRLIPVLGEIITIITILLGFGTVIVTRFGANPVRAFEPKT